MALCSIAKGSKRPWLQGWNERENAITDPVTATKLMGGMGLLHSYSGTMALDIDNEADATAWLLARGFNLDHASSAPDAVTIKSGRSGKAKLLYRLPNNIVPVETLKVAGPEGLALDVDFR